MFPLIPPRIKNWLFADQMCVLVIDNRGHLDFAVSEADTVNETYFNTPVDYLGILLDTIGIPGIQFDVEGTGFFADLLLAGNGNKVAAGFTLTGYQCEVVASNDIGNIAELSQSDFRNLKYEFGSCFQQVCHAWVDVDKGSGCSALFIGFNIVDAANFQPLVHDRGTFWPDVMAFRQVNLNPDTALGTVDIRIESVHPAFYAGAAILRGVKRNSAANQG